jgi:hypothetical protein
MGENGVKAKYQNLEWQKQNGQNQCGKNKNFPM